MYETLYEQISRACCFISVFLDGELIGEGTGFAISSDGAVFTAAHVITCRTPIKESDYRDPALKIYVKFPGVPVLEYHVALCGITLQIPQFKDNIQLDQALILPRSPVQLPFSPFTVGSPPRLGEEVFFAGYSDELELPFNVDRLLKSETEGADEFFQAMQKGYRADMTGPMIKRGVVGNIRRIHASQSVNDLKLECDIFYLDNSVHSGASGGPVVNRNGCAVGVIVQRATTSVSQAAAPGLFVPSGATVGLGLQTLPAIYKWLSNQSV
ncbi:serine protease [Duganella sp. BuS-21]|uniref:S1 family peptidase n=1 Tax=Duganella sp. BuS-21 TaxID=2943848 RepID=UPI0035A622A5